MLDVENISKLLIILISVFFLSSLVSATELQNIESINPQGTQAIGIFGDLDMQNNNIENFFAGQCSSGEVVVQVYDDGGYQCMDVSNEVASDYVSIDGDAMNGTLDMSLGGNDAIIGISNLGGTDIVGSDNIESSAVTSNELDETDIYGLGWGNLAITQSDVNAGDVGTAGGITSNNGDIQLAANDLDSSGNIDDFSGADDLDTSGTLTRDSFSLSDDGYIQATGTSLGGTGSVELDVGSTDSRYVERSGDTMSGSLEVGNGLIVDGSTRHGYSGITSTTSDNGHLMLDSDGGNLYLNWDENNDIYLAGGGGDVDLMDGSGNVGVGTRSPSYHLDVRGDARFTDNVNMDGNNLNNVDQVSANEGEFSASFQLPVGTDQW